MLAYARRARIALGASAGKGDRPRRRGSAALALPAMSDFVALPGRGVHALLDGYEVWIGGDRLYAEHGETMPADLLDGQGAGSSRGQERARRCTGRSNAATGTARTRPRGGWLGLIGMADTVRDGPARGRSARSGRLGMQRTVMLTGDNAQVAASVAAQAGIDEYHANLLPEEKVGRLADVRARYGEVMMIGDGMNDAPALANASVGVAMGAAGTRRRARERALRADG